MPNPNSPNLTNLSNVTNLPNLQLTIEGEEVAYPMPPGRRLTERQRDLMRYVRHTGTITTREARLFYADPLGALYRLGRLGIIRRRRDGSWEAAP